MRDITYYRFCHSWLRGLLKSNEGPPALVKRWSFHGPRGMDEVKRSICLPESMAPTTEFHHENPGLLLSALEHFELLEHRTNVPPSRALWNCSQRAPGALWSAPK